MNCEEGEFSPLRCAGVHDVNHHASKYDRHKIGYLKLIGQTAVVTEQA